MRAVSVEAPPDSRPRSRRLLLDTTAPHGLDARRIAPVLLAGVLSAVYVALSPSSLDLPAHLLRSKLFSAEGFGLWNNWWYGGAHDVLYSVLFPPIAAATSPQLAAAVAATATAGLFEPLARRRFGPDAWLGSLWFALGTATSLYTGRLTFAFGLLPAVATVLALQRRQPWLASGLGLLTALCSPVAAVFAALGGGAFTSAAWIGERRLRAGLPGLAIVVCSLLPVGLLAIAFPEGGTEPFAFSTLWPLPLIAIGLLLVIPKDDYTFLCGVVLYTAGCVVAYLAPTAVGSNAARLGDLLAGPLAALFCWPRRWKLLLAVSLPLLYIQCYAPIRDLTNASGQAADSPSFYRPLLSFLERQPGASAPTFRIEIPFTSSHWEAYEVAPRFPIARGWERQLDIEYDHLFYGGRLTSATYEAWLHKLAVRFVAVADTSLDYSAVREVALIDRGLPYLRLVATPGRWRVYQVLGAPPIVQGVAQLKAIGPNSFSLQVTKPGTALVRVHFTPYWALTDGAGCVAPDGQFTKLTLRRAGPARLGIRFALARIDARSPRCT